LTAGVVNPPVFAGAAQLGCRNPSNVIDALTVSITRPLSGYVYACDRQLMPTFSGNTAILGKITIFACISDTSDGVDRVDFLIDETVTYTSYLPPYHLTWNTWQYARGNHVIAVHGFTVDGHTAVDDITVNVFSLRRNQHAH
jgi:hypothetical protein